MKKNIIDNQDIIKKVSSCIKDDKIKCFVSQFLHDIPRDALSNVEQNIISAACSNLFDLFHKKFKGKFIINLFEQEKDSDYVILNVISENVPFLIDSLNNELQSHEVDIKLLAYNVISAKDIDENNDSDKKIAFIQFYISNWFDDAFYNQLVKKITKILECVKFSVDDWKKMKNIISGCIENLSQNFGKKDIILSAGEIDFLKFLHDDKFIFLGYIKGFNNKAVSGDALGLLKHDLYKNDLSALGKHDGNKHALILKKSHIKSVVHRNSFMLSVIVSQYDKDGKFECTHEFYGFLITKIYYMSVLDIPLINEKILYVINNYGYPRDSHNSKELITALEEFPRSELLQISKEELFNIASGIVSLTINPRIKLFIREDRDNRYYSCLIFIPKMKFNTQVRKRIESILCQQFNGNIAKHYVKIGEGHLTRLQLVVNINKGAEPNYEIARVEKLIASAINVWEDDLKDSLEFKLSKKESDRLFKKYKESFSVKYTNTFSPQQSLHDIDSMEEVLHKNKTVFKIYNSAKSGKELIQMKIFALDEELPLSTIFPIINNLGLFIIDVATFAAEINHCGDAKKVYIHYFRTQLKLKKINFTDELRHNLEEGLERIWNDDIENDGFNSLIFYASISYREATLFRAYFKYLKQIQFEFTQEYILSTLIKYSDISKLLIKLFNVRFNLDAAYTAQKEQEILDNIQKQLSDIQIFVEDKIISTYLMLILATKRTNFFVIGEDGLYRDFISLKMASREIDDLPLPRPEIDTFVYSAKFEAIHLRGGKVARGGLRWTDRSEDFRKVVLDLMKAQMTKNSLIVPSGCKGGFVVKQVPEDKDEFFKFGIECYKNFLRGILDITDNIVSQKIVSPKQVIKHDSEDTYFVVAADKGTATFSDFANGVSKEYNFWLGDAFASGGSAGYDHKKIGITAKGAWICVKKHFEQIGIDLDKNEFTVAGIGDMSGDVFGNGMLLSRKIKLIAAFNHMHIFIDPNPDTEISFEERERLFDMKGSQWSDYNESLISKGGGVFERSVKQIKISDEMKIALSINSNSLSPTQLIKAILKSQVDLLWNGGIGTYVKGEFEDDSSIGDKVNDNLRIFGRNLKCKVVGEGGNLGCTQNGRIEYARRGGRINTDFIDNSAGVDCSDREVNIKIALQHEIQNKKMSLEQRNKLLEQLTDDVEELVLEDNEKQSILINLEIFSVAKRMRDYVWLINHFEEKGELQREVENLPSAEELTKLESEKEYLTRPEIAILVAYSKNSIANILNKLDFMDDKFFNDTLFSYFPKHLEEHFNDTLLLHKLKKEVINTVISNDIVNMLGVGSFHLFMEEKGYDAEAIVKAFYIVVESMGINEIWDKTKHVPCFSNYNSKYKCLLKIQKIVKRGIRWILMHYQKIDNIDEVIKVYKKGFKILSNEFSTDKFLSLVLNKQVKTIGNLIKIEAGEVDGILKDVAKLSLVSSLFNIISINQSSNINIQQIAKMYFEVKARFYIDKMLELISKNDPISGVERLANDYTENDLQKLLMKLVFKQLNLKDKDNNILGFIEDKDKLKSFDEFATTILVDEENSSYLLINVLINKIKELGNLDNIQTV
jgi:glutamate dehydrogenase